jgi:hypothetical protein
MAFVKFRLVEGPIMASTYINTDAITSFNWGAGGTRLFTHHNDTEYFELEHTVDEVTAKIAHALAEHETAMEYARTAAHDTW